MDPILLMKLKDTKRLDLQALMFLLLYLKIVHTPVRSSVAEDANANDDADSQNEFVRTLSKWNMGMIIQSSALPFHMKWKSTLAL